MIRRYTVLIFIVLIICGSGFCQAQQSWYTEAVASAHHIGGFSPDSLQLDNNGSPAMAYGGDGLYFARFDGTSWQVDVLDSSPMVAHRACLRFDAENDAHIVYSNWYPDWDKYGLKYVYQENGYWQKRIIPDMEYAGSIFSMDLDSNGRPWILYYNDEADTVEMINDNGAGGWVNDTLFLSMVPVICLELVMEGDDPRFAYTAGNPTDCVLRMGYKTSTGYEFDPIDSTPGAGVSLDITIDTSGFVHMSYRNGVEGALYHVETEPGGWPGVPVQVDTTEASSGYYTSIVVDEFNRPIISYIVTSSDILKLAQYDGANWTLKTVSTTGLDVTNTSVTYNSLGGIGISFMEDNTLKHAQIDGAAVTFSTIDISKRLVRPTCTVMNSAGNPRIMYRDQFDGYLYLVMPYGSGWRSMQLPNIEISVRDAAMAINDSTGLPAIAWFSTASGYLMYMEQTLSGWNVETVDTQDMYYSNECNLVIDSQGIPHIVYTTEVPSMRYATRAGSTWTTTDVYGSEAAMPEIKVDATGRRHVIFFNTSPALNYVVSSDGVTWEIDVIDGVISMFSVPALEVDSEGIPHVMYPDPDGLELLHYWKSGSMWDSETVISGDIGYGAQTDYLIDEAGVHWMAWNDIMEYNVKVASNATGSWIVDVADNRFMEVGDLHLKTDPINRLSLSYSDALNADIYYAQLRNDIWYDIGMPSVFFGAGSSFKVTRKIYNTTAQDLTADEYFFLDVYGEYWFAPSWTQDGHAMVTSASAHDEDYEIPLDFTWPTGAGSATGIRLWGGIVDSSTSQFLDYDMVEFGWTE